MMVASDDGKRQWNATTVASDDGGERQWNAMMVLTSDDGKQQWNATTVASDNEKNIRFHAPFLLAGWRAPRSLPMIPNFLGLAIDSYVADLHLNTS